MKVYQSETNNYIDMNPLGKVRYVGESFGVDGLTDGEVYAVIEVDENFGDLRIVDDSEEDYLYSILRVKHIRKNTLISRNIKQYKSK